ncbi:hypothetical protein CcaCcLH18_03180 [Colletotrichum camelliae]|nr:hypothetical protein CcaCcLH18_03180 [Colletotrichum camelliae]
MLKTRNECVREASEALRRARASLFNLSIVNKTWRQLLFKESYRVVSIHGAYAANQLIDLFRVLYNNPTISNSIEEFVLHIEIEDNPNRIALDNMAYLLSPDLPRLSEDEEVIEGSQSSYLALLDSYYDENPTIRNSKYIIWAAGLVLSRLTHLTDLTLSVSDHTLIHGHLILFGSFSTRFPSLKSITLEDALRSNDSADLSYDLHWDPYAPKTWDILFEAAPNVSDIFVQSWTDFQRFSQPTTIFEANITSLVFDDVTIDYDDLAEMVEFAKCLEKFVCRNTDIPFDFVDHDDLLEPLLTALSERAATLRTIVIGTLPKWSRIAVLHGHRTFSNFSRLQNLWVDARVVEPLTLMHDETGRPDVCNAVIGTLPTSLERLHVDDFPERDLVWLTENCESKYPTLKEVGFYAGLTKMDQFKKRFREIGVTAVYLDQDPQLW